MRFHGLDFMKFEENSKLLNRYLPAVLFLVAFFWKLPYINVRDISLDEPYSIYNAQKGVIDIIKISTEGEPTPPLFMLLLHFWIKLFGLEPASVRFLPLIFNALTVVFVYLTGKRFFSFWAGMIASGLFLFSTAHFFHGLETRAYSLKALETAASLYFYLGYIKNRNDRKALAGLVASNIMLVYTHYFGWFVVFSQLLSNLLYLRSYKTLWSHYKPQLYTFLGFIPMLWVLVNQFLISKKYGTYVEYPKPFDYINHLYAFLNSKYFVWIVLYTLGAGLVFLTINLILKRKAYFSLHAVTLLIWWIVPYTVMFFVSWKIPMFNGRYTLFTTIGMYLLAGALIDLLFVRNKFILPLVSVFVLASMYYYLQILPRSTGYRELKKSIEYVKSIKKEGDIIIIYPKWSELQFAYYYDRTLFMDHEDIYNTLKKNDVFRVWNQTNASWFIRDYPNRRVIYVQDGVIAQPNEQIFRYLDTTFVRVDSVHFPFTINVGVYELRDSTAKTN